MTDWIAVAVLLNKDLDGVPEAKRLWLVSALLRDFYDVNVTIDQVRLALEIEAEP